MKFFEKSQAEEPQAPTAKAEKKIEIHSETVDVGGEKITVSWKEFSPAKNAEVPTDSAVVFFPGWSAGGAETLNHLTQRFAEESGNNAFSITTRAEKVIPDSLYQEAKAVREIIIEKGLKQITLAGHSEGGSKAVNLIDILQKENPDIFIRGLALLDPVGLYEQSQRELIGAFAKDTMVNTPATAAKNFLKDPSLTVKALQAGSDIIFNIAREIKMGGMEYIARFHALLEIAKANKRYAKVKCPVVLIQGEQDPVSSHDRVIPSEKDPVLLSKRREILKNTFFPNSPQVDMLVPKKIGHHGLPHFRADEVAKTSIYMLDRYWRKQK
ncbi:MAG: alpha/beta hydrolase [Candidatus Liptonbacteria bacterium]|nr:alpha/beta hydrolase [Candidatus Liptonbacteria bacterium]